MKRIGIFFIGLMLTGILFSCQEKAPGKDDQMKASDANANSKVRCLEMVYPLTYIMPDGSTITCNNRRELIAVRIWYREHPDVTERPTLQYPVEIKFKGQIMTINNDGEMKRIKEACNKGRKKCFELVYPVTYIMPDGTEITINSKDDKEGRLAIKAWYEAHPDCKEKHSLKYPVDIKYKDGTIKTINNQEEMRRARMACK